MHDSWPRAPRDAARVEEAIVAARAISSATISFGLVAIPIKLFTPIKSQSGIRFRQLDSKGAPVKQQYISSRTGDVVERADMQKGYEYAKGQYVTFSKEELEAVEAQSTGAIEIHEFVPLEQVDPLYFQKSYYLAPDKGGAKPYHLLLEAMKSSGRVAVAKYPARGKDYLVLIRPMEDVLVMEQLYYADEIRGADEIPVDEAEVKKNELKLAQDLIDQITSDAFEPEKYTDTVKQKVLELIERKVAGEEIVTINEEGAAPANVVDLMDALKASIADGKKPAKRATARKKASKKTTRKTARK